MIKMNKTCRLCLKEDEVMNALSEFRKGLPISVLVMIICPIKIESNDMLPKNVCDSCLEICLNSFKLRIDSVKNELYLREKLESFVKLEKPEELESFVYAESFHEDSFAQTYTVRSNNTCQDTAKIWNYMGALCDEQGQMIDSDNIYCSLCVDNKIIKKFKKQVSSTHLYAHLKRVHGIEVDQNQSGMLECDICGLSVVDKVRMETHMIQHIDEGSPPFKVRKKFQVNLKNKAQGRSPVWNYFGKLIDLNSGQIVNPFHYYCKICVEESDTVDKKYSSGSSTSALALHLRKLHQIGEEKESKVEKAPCRKLNQNISTEIIHNASGFAVHCYKASKSGSFAWYFFGKLVDLSGAAVEREKNFFFCKLCVQEENLKIKYVNNCSTSNLILHLKNVHGVESGTVESHLLDPVLKDPSKFEESIEKSCTICNAQFSTRKAYFNHLRTNHKDLEPTDFICHVCSKTFTKSYMLSKHMRVHEKRKYNCSQCPAAFAFPENLKRHENIHDPNHYRRYQCDRCSKSYSELKALHQHIRVIHLNVVRERNFRCPLPQCEMKFFAANHLRQHSLKHTGEVC